MTKDLLDKKEQQVLQEIRYVLNCHLYILLLSIEKGEQGVVGPDGTDGISGNPVRAIRLNIFIILLFRDWQVQKEAKERAETEEKE